MIQYFKITLLIILSFSFACDDQKSLINQNNRWSENEAWDWYDKQPWLVGTNFITSSAINQLEFWQEETFDPWIYRKTINQTLVG